MLVEPTTSLGASLEATLIVAGLAIGPLMVYAGIGVFLATRADERWRRAVQCETDEGRPYNWLIPSTVVALLAFAPLGIAAVIHAARVEPFLALGRFEDARASARRARMWFWLSAAGGATVLVGWLTMTTFLR